MSSDSNAESSLHHISEDAHGRVVAVDLDDVLSQTNREAAEWHNDEYGTNMDVSQCYYYHWWKNPHWGTPQETVHKVKRLYASGRVYETKPVPGALEGAQKLREMGYTLVIVTAREKEEMDHTERWLERHFPGIFQHVVCTGSAFSFVGERSHEITTKLSKVQACRELGARVLIDDSLENAMQLATADPPVPVLLLGAHEWNKRLSVVRSSAPPKADEPGDEEPEPDVTQMSFAQRTAREGGREWWRDDEAEAQRKIEENHIHRVRDWEEVVRWVEGHLQKGKSGLKE